MSKKKRIRRDIEKLLRSGRYWDLLRLMESEGIASSNTAEHKAAWKGAIEQALRQESAFDRFRHEVGTLKSLPDIPDFNFLMRLKGFIEGRGPAEELLGLKGLSPAAERLRDKFDAFDSSFPQQEKLRELLKKFITEPTKITRRHFEQTADLISAVGLQTVVRQMGDLIMPVRHLNQKAAVDRGWEGIPLARLGEVDCTLSSLSGKIPPALREILLHPFTYNIALLFRWMARELTGDRASKLARAIPYLLPIVAGEKFEEVERKLLVGREDWLETAAEDLDTLGRKVSELSLEEKLTLLKGLRLSARDRACKAPNFERPDFEDMDFFDDEDSVEEGESEALRLSRAVLLLHRSALKDIADRTATMSPREKKELVRVMEPVLFQDLEHILDALENSGEILDLLASAIHAGCAGTRMGLVALLAGSRFRKSDLRKLAEKHLDQSPPPTQDDVEWLAKDWAEWYYPSIRALKPLLNRYREDPAMLGPLAFELCSMTEFALIETSLQADLMSLPGLPAELLGIPSKPEEPGILRRELVALTEYEALEPIRRFLKCYSKDCFTVEGHLCWLNALHSKAKGGAWEFALSEIRRYKSINAGSRGIVPVKAFKTLLSEKVEAMWFFLKERPDELAALPAELLKPLLVELLALTKSPLAHHTFLIRLEKLLAARVETGDKSVRPIADKIRRTLLDLAKRGRKPTRAEPVTHRKSKR